MIEFEDVSRNYGTRVALSGLNLSIPSGQLFALLGHNGAGKTTTIKMLVGLLRPNSGNVRICGFDVVRQTREANRLLGYVPDEPYLYDKLTGREFLQFVGEMYGLEKNLLRRRLDEEIANFSLSEFVDDLAETYSHGMKQRVVFASALLHDPSVLVVDEPMVGLDPRSMRLVKDYLKAKASAGTTIFMSTHTLAVAEEIADRIAVLEQGKLRFLGTLSELRHRVKNPENMSLEHLYLELTAK